MQDRTLVKLGTVIQKGWLESQSELPDDIKPYYLYRFILHIINHIITMEGRIIVPNSLRCQFLKKIRETHLGFVNLNLLAKTFVYWPRYNNDVKAMCKQC